MQARTIIPLSIGAAGVLAFGVWLGGASAERRAAPAPTAVHAPATTRVARVDAPQLPAKKLVPGLAEDLRDRDPLVRRNAVTEVDDPRVLVEASRDADLGVAVAATEGLGRLYRDGQLGAGELVARTKSDAPAKVRVAAINGLGLVASNDSAAALSELLARGSEIDRRSAAIVLVHQDPALAVPALIGALRDSDDNVRMNAREALKAIARGRDLGGDADAWARWWQSRNP